MIQEPDKLQTITDQNLQEMRQHGSKDFPIGVYLDDFSKGDQTIIPWHWHEEIQFDLVMEGRVHFQIGSKAFDLEAGQCIFINTGVLHQIFPVEGTNGKLYAYVLRDSLLETDVLSGVYQKCLAPVIRGQVDCVAFQDGTELDMLASKCLAQIKDSFRQKVAGYQIEVKGQLCLLWSLILKKERQNFSTVTARERRDMDRVKEAIGYIRLHYQEEVALESIAGHLAISKSELCRCFKRVMNTTPYDYLIQCRIREATKRLRTTDEKVLDIALQCGFDSSGHMGRYFRKYCGCSPSDLRRRE